MGLTPNEGLIMGTRTVISMPAHCFTLPTGKISASTR
ncbi:MAG: hypothetical protein R2759_20635 [Bacteroidales bacterium]